jgi:hypothetical protein
MQRLNKKTPNRHADGATATELLTTPAEERQAASNAQHLRWQHSHDTYGFCGEPLVDGPYVVLTQADERQVCSACMAILRLYRRSGLWEGFGGAPNL